ncbi:MAG: hypothetical protein J2P19_21545 [Pseudonocardia sp.]|nr:hypothetical protein [Pseudonocardia sp.]
MATRGPGSSNALEVLLDGAPVRVLSPGVEPCLFGRGIECDLRIGHRGPMGADRNMSRIAGSIRWDGRWSVHNESGSRPFDIIVRGMVIPLPPRLTAEPSVWAVSPPGLEVHLVTPTSEHLIGLVLPDPQRPRGHATADHLDDEGPSTFPLSVPSRHERLLLAAKFLSGPLPGDAIGNSEAAELVNRVRPERTRPVTARAVEDVARRWRDRLEALGVTGIDGRENINHLGRQLLAYGFIRQENKGLLRARSWQPPRR